MSKTAIHQAIYDRVSVMTVANGFNFDWTSIKSTENGANITNGVVLSADLGVEAVLDGGVVQNGSYKLQCPITIKGCSKKGSSTLASEEFDLQDQKNKMCDDIRSAFAFCYTALCSAGGDYLEYMNELEPAETFKEDAFEVEVNCGYTVRFLATVYDG